MSRISQEAEARFRAAMSAAGVTTIHLVEERGTIVVMSMGYRGRSNDAGRRSVRWLSALDVMRVEMRRLCIADLFVWSDRIEIEMGRVAT